MKLYSLLSIVCLFSALVSALPRAIPVEDTNFDLTAYLEDAIEARGNQEEVDAIYDFINFQKRDEETIASLLITVNNSGILWDILDEVVGHEERIERLANNTASLINSLGGTLDASNLAKIGAGLNISETFGIVSESGLVTSILNGILLDDSYRPVLVDIIYRTAKSNMDILLYIVGGVFHKRSLEKRASYSGSLETFVTNIISTILSSQKFMNTLADIVNALNDTGVAVYTIKRFIADESYQNMTVQYLKDVYHTGAIKISASKLNLTSIVGDVVDNQQLVKNVIRKLLSGKISISSTFGKYGSAIKQIVNDLENKGLFQELNDYIFPSSTATSKVTSTNKKETVPTIIRSSSIITISTQSTSSMDSSANKIQKSNIPIIKTLLTLQTLVFGGVLLMI